MRTLFIILSVIFILLAIVFTILPMGTIAFLPLGLALFFAFLAFIKSESNKKALPKFLLIFTIITSIAVIGKVIFAKDIVEEDQQFDITKQASKSEAINDLEDLEDLEELE